MAFLPIRYGQLEQNSTPKAVTITSTTSFFEIDGGYELGFGDGLVFQNNKELLCTIDGLYIASWSMRVALDMSANKQINGGILINGVIANNSISGAKINTANDKGFMGRDSRCILVADDIVSLAVQNEDSLHNIIVENASFKLIKVSN